MRFTPALLHNNLGRRNGHGRCVNVHFNPAYPLALENQKVRSARIKDNASRLAGETGCIVIPEGNDILTTEPTPEMVAERKRIFENITVRYRRIENRDKKWNDIFGKTMRISGLKRQRLYQQLC